MGPTIVRMICSMDPIIGTTTRSIQTVIGTMIELTTQIVQMYTTIKAIEQIEINVTIISSNVEFLLMGTMLNTEIVSINHFDNVVYHDNNNEVLGQCDWTILCRHNYVNVLQVYEIFPQILILDQLQQRRVHGLQLR